MREDKQIAINVFPNSNYLGEKDHPFILALFANETTLSGIKSSSTYSRVLASKQGVKFERQQDGVVSLYATQKAIDYLLKEIPKETGFVFDKADLKAMEERAKSIESQLLGSR